MIEKIIKKFSDNKAIKNLDGVALFSDPTASTNYKQGDIVPIQILKFANRNHPFY